MLALALWGGCIATVDGPLDGGNPDAEGPGPNTNGENPGSPSPGNPELPGPGTPDTDPPTDPTELPLAPQGPNVDRTDNKLRTFQFNAKDADPAASRYLAPQLAHLDTRVAPAGLLVVYLHGAGTPSTCGSSEMGKVLASMGFHVFGPCYSSDYGVGNCGSNIGACRLEAFDGENRSSVINIARAESIEERVGKGLQRLQTLDPAGDWQFFLENGAPKWSRIIISGISHGASTAGIVGQNRSVARVVMLSGPLDTNQSWLAASSLTPANKFFGFTHTGDEQHQGHLAAWNTMNLSGAGQRIDGSSPPYGNSARLITAAPTSNGHSSLEAGGVSPKTGGQYTFIPAWTYLFGR